MITIFESRSIASLLARNFEAIERAYKVLDPDGGYDEFLRVNDEILNATRDIDLRAFLEGKPIQIFGSSESMSRLHALQYAYLLTRHAEIAASENRSENTLMVLSEACFFSGFAEGMGKASELQVRRANTSVNASHAAKTKHDQRSAPVKHRLLELLGEQSREHKWKTLGAAVRNFERELEQCIRDNKLRLDYSNLPRTIAGWCKKDTEFSEALSKFVSSLET